MKKKHKIKAVYPVKSDSLCQKCFYGIGNSCSSGQCAGCEMHTAKGCKCLIYKDGEPCKEFKRDVLKPYKSPFYMI